MPSSLRGKRDSKALAQSREAKLGALADNMLCCGESPTGVATCAGPGRTENT